MIGPQRPYFQLIYRGVDISSELDPMTTSVSYTDHLHGKAAGIDVTVQDKDGRWKGSWMPEHGDTMTLTIFDGRGGTLPAGTFELDEPDAGGNRGGDTMTMRGLAAPVMKPLRTEKTRAFEKQSLSAIVNKVAGEAGLSVEGRIASVEFERVTQRRERDLEFLRRLAEDTGHYFNVRNTRAVFTEHASIDGQGPALTLTHAMVPSVITSYRLRGQRHETYSKAEATYLDRDRKKLIKGEATDPLVTTGDVLRIAGERFENDAHAERLAKSRLHLANRMRRSGSVTVVAEVRLVAGVVVGMADFGRYSGNLLADTTTHTMTRGGYDVSAKLVEARKR